MTDSAPYLVFAHLNAERAPLYRALLGELVRSKARFALHLRPVDFARALAAAGQTADESTIASALAQLVEWGNLEAHPDTGDVATVEDFYRPRHLYQLTPAGEAAERAVGFFEQALRERGELQAVALADVRVLLEELAEILAALPLDGGKAHRALLALRARFEELTAKAQAFMASLQRTIDLHGLALEALLAYKQSLIDYLERFIGELLMATAEIAELLVRIDAGVSKLVDAVAEREMADALAASPDERASLVARARADWTSRWRGLRAWFIPEAGEPSQAELLRQRARSAIPALLSAVANLNDRRIARSDRSADLRSLALWFAEAPSEAHAHRLWRAAFGLAPARHLGVDQETLGAREAEPVPSSTSWLEAAPIGISPRLRETGRAARPGPATRVIDRSSEKAALAQLLEQEARQIEAARQRLGARGRIRLSELGALGRREFDLLLDLLGEALARPVRPAEGAVATSGDGTLVIKLEPPEPHNGEPPLATIETEAGWLTAPDFVVTIADAFEASS